MIGRRPLSDMLSNWRANLKRLRAEKGWTQQDVAEMLSIEQPSYSAIENATKDIMLSTAAKLATLFGVPVLDLFAPPNSGPPRRQKRGA